MSNGPSLSDVIASCPVPIDTSPLFVGPTTTCTTSSLVALWPDDCTSPATYVHGYNCVTTDACGNTEIKSYTSAGILVSDCQTRANGDTCNIVNLTDGHTCTTYGFGGGGPVLDFSIMRDATGCVLCTDYMSPDASVQVQTDYNADGSCVTENFSGLTGCYSLTTTDTCGNVTIQNYSASGCLTSDSWTKINGSHGSDTCNAQGTVVSSNAQLGSSAACITYGNQNVTVTATEGCGVTDSIAVGNGNNQITLGQGNDCVTAGNGNNTVTLGSGNNTVTLGSGKDTINTNGGCNTLNLGAGQYTINNNCGTESVNLSKVNSSQLWFTEKGGNLVISVLGSKESITVANWAANEQLCNVSTADCKSISGTGIAQMVQAMACFAPPAAGQTCYTAAEQKALAPQLAANWH